MRSTAQLFVMLLMYRPTLAEDVALKRLDLPNGIRVALAQVPQATQQVTFTFLPLNIANDEQNRAQWSHLLEHMIIRSTDPESLKARGIEVNGETTATYLRLDTYAAAEQWKQALEKQAQWLNVTVIKPEVLLREKDNIQAEEQFTAKAGQTTKFAMAAWNQVVSHGATQVHVHGDVANAKAVDVQACADTRVPRDASVLIASIGPIDVNQVQAEIERLFGQMAKKPWSPAKPALSETAKDGPMLAATWDLPTRHAIWWWPVPDQFPATLGAATLLARAIHAQHAMKPRRDPRVRQLAVYPCVVTPRGSFFVIDACLALPGDIPNLKAGVPLIRPDEVLADVQKTLKAMTPGQPGSQALEWIGTMMMEETPRSPDFKAMSKKMPEAMRDKTEGAWLLSMMNYEYAFKTPAAVALSATKNFEPAAFHRMLSLLTTQPAGTLELMPENPVPATSPASMPD